ncbi:hypothetical protein NGF69_14525 [Enterococcus casseliflavus]|uniref:hypothetical protein n=1 Tax=unclassified Enterococcus TaxID=2608891 RepID=UPI000B6DABC8|nr:hypothetical protein [Enterococcus sp. 4E1_DIV0656]MEC5316781.1 hypothetical protein [Enterococcus casseliflavus]OTO11154.1 hypothetical protein A5882_003079 [Enterococcus sp. 4E1_DIV0656]
MQLLQLLLLAIIFVSFFMVLITRVLSMTNGLIFSRSPQQFKAHAHDSNYEKERQAGKRLKEIIFRRIIPLGIASLLIMD